LGGSYKEISALVCLFSDYSSVVKCMIYRYRTKTSNDKSHPQNSKFLHFVRNKSSNSSGPSLEPPLGELKGVVNSIDAIAGGILVSVESGEHLEIKVIHLLSYFRYIFSCSFDLIFDNRFHSQSF